MQIINFLNLFDMKKAVSKLFGYECMYEIHESANVVIFWVNGRKQIWLGIDDFFNHFTTLNN